VREAEGFTTEETDPEFARKSVSYEMEPTENNLGVQPFPPPCGRSTVIAANQRELFLSPTATDLEANAHDSVLNTYPHISRISFLAVCRLDPPKVNAFGGATGKPSGGASAGGGAMAGPRQQQCFRQGGKQWRPLLAPLSPTAGVPVVAVPAVVVAVLE
jgi:hypothetical protein